LPFLYRANRLRLHSYTKGGCRPCFSITYNRIFGRETPLVLCSASHSHQLATAIRVSFLSFQLE